MEKLRLLFVSIFLSLLFLTFSLTAFGQGYNQNFYNLYNYPDKLNWYDNSYYPYSFWPQNYYNPPLWPWGTSCLWSKSGGNVYRSSGNVGIGTNYPNSKLDVYGNIRMSNPSSYFIMYDGALNRVALNVLPSEDYVAGGLKIAGGFSTVYIPDHVNVGIGTASPAYELDIIGDINFTGDLFRNGSPFGGGSEECCLWTDAGSYIHADNAANVVVTDSGKVGIGTTNPASMLDVNGTVTIGGNLDLQGALLNSMYGASVVIDDFLDVRNSIVNEAPNAAVTINDSLTVDHFSNLRGELLVGVDKMIVRESGNVGIGTMEPSAKLDVHGGQDIGLSVVTDGFGAGYFHNNSSTDNAYAVQAYSMTWTGATRSLFAYNKSSSGTAVYGYAENSSGTTYAIYGKTNSDNGFAGYFEGGKNYFSGNVGIGTTSPSYKLQVNGSFAATSKNFDIPDPRYNDVKKRLLHGALEGPENAVYYRGEARLVDGMAMIDLPEYFEYLTRKEGRTVQLTAQNGWSPLYIDGVVENGKFSVKTTEYGNPAQEFFWEVKAVRADIDQLSVEVTREVGIKMSEP